MLRGAHARMHSQGGALSFALAVSCFHFTSKVDACGCHVMWQHLGYLVSPYADNQRLPLA